MSASCTLGENGPGGFGLTWLCLTSWNAARSVKLTQGARDRDPEVERAAEELKALRDAEKATRQAAERDERARLRAGIKESEERQRAKVSQRRQAKREAEAVASRKTAAELLAARQANAAKARAAFVARHPAQPRPSRACPRVAPPGKLTVHAAAKAAPCSQGAIYNAINRGDLPIDRKGKSTYVRLEDVRSYLAGSRERKRAQSVAAIGKARAAKAARRQRVPA